MTYREFINQKISVAPVGGFGIEPGELPAVLKPHQRDIVAWALRGGCRAVFANVKGEKLCLKMAFADYRKGNL